MFSSSHPNSFQNSFQRVRTLALSALVGVAALSPVFPQTTITSTISGSVRDPSGAGVTGAEVTTVHTATAGERRARTNEAGDFVLSSLRPGEYNLTVRAPGFKTLERKALMLTAAEWLPVGNLTLEMGTLEERVVVTAQGAAVQTVSAERSAAITSSQVDQLAMRGRSVTSLLSLLPGVVELVDPESPTGTTNFSVLGGRANTNNITLDGVTLSNPGGAPNAALTISMDAVSEVKVMLSNYQAEYGRMSGASIQMVSKSGTRDFHGLGSYLESTEFQPIGLA